MLNNTIFNSKIPLDICTCQQQVSKALADIQIKIQLHDLRFKRVEPFSLNVMLLNPSRMRASVEFSIKVVVCLSESEYY